MKNGTLRSRKTGREIESVAKVGEDSMMHHIVLDPEGSQSENNFPKDLWEFVPAPPKEFPSGSIIKTVGRYPMLNLNNQWFQISYKGGEEFALKPRSDADARARLGWARAVLFDGETILDKEEYL